jgi:hypothetical protein
MNYITILVTTAGIEPVKAFGGSIASVSTLFLAFAYLKLFGWLSSVCFKAAIASQFPPNLLSEYYL